MEIIMIVPWFPSPVGTSPESQQGIFEYRQTVRLAAKGNEFKVISIKWHGQPDHEIIDKNIEVHRITPLFIFPGIRYPIPNFITLNRIIKKLCQPGTVDLIIYSHMIYLTAMPIFWLKYKNHIPSVVTTDAFPGISWFYGNKVVDLIGYLYSISIGKQILKLANKVQLMSSGLTEYAHKLNLNIDKTVTITRGVDTELFKPRNNINRLREELGIGKEDIVILYVGRFDLVKGVKYLLKAAESILNNHTNIKFLFVGEGSLRQKYEKITKLYPKNIIFTGWKSNIPQIMNISDIFVLPSLSEGAANAVMEASASALPVIATEVGEIPRIIMPDKTGILVKPKDVGELVDAINKLIADLPLARRMGEMGRERMEKRYNWDTICSRLEALYLDAVKDNKFTG